MDSLQSLDVALFRFVNQGLKNPFFDWLMPFFNSNVAFIPALIVLAVVLTVKCGVRGRLLVVFLLLTFLIGDPLIINSLKKWIARPRPFAALTDTYLLVGRTDNPSMPSGHAANWFAAATVAFIFYRRTLYFMLPIALIEAFSRAYLGVHYPSDVTVGGLLGIGYGFGIVWLSNQLWGSVGRRLFPLWWAQLPSLIKPEARPALGPASAFDDLSPERRAVELDRHWVRFAYLLIAAFLAAHWIYLAADKIELTEDEAYQWLWSKHLALSYFSKPPLIAYTQFLGTGLWGDTEFGIRFMAPLLGAVASWLLVRFLAREVNGYVAFLSVLTASAMPLLMVGATLMTIDSLSVLFWLAAMIAGWRAIQRDSTALWLWTGMWMGLGFLSKYIALFQWLCWGVFFFLSPPARAQLRRPGPYLALLINLLCLTPVIVWNAQNSWVTMNHLANRGGLDRNWEPSLRFLGDFVGSELFLLNPVFAIGIVWAATKFWKIGRQRPVWLYLFAMGAPLFIFYFVFTLRARVQPNWIAPAVLPLLCLGLIYWDERWRNGTIAVRHWLMAGLAMGWVFVIPLHDTRLIAKTVGTPLPVWVDPLTRVLGWRDMAGFVGQARTNLLAEGKPVFVIASHYGTTSLLNFYVPGARQAVPNDRFVYYLSSDEPKNQFYFWSDYKGRKGDNAIFVGPVDRDAHAPPASLLRDFESVTDLGMQEILYKGRVFHRIQLFACRNLR